METLTAPEFGWGAAIIGSSTSIVYDDTEPPEPYDVDRMEDRYIEGVQGNWADDLGQRR